MPRYSTAQRNALDALAAIDLKWREEKTAARRRAEIQAEAAIDEVYQARADAVMAALDTGLSKRRVYSEGLHTSDAKTLEAIIAKRAPLAPKLIPAPTHMEAESESPMNSEPTDYQPSDVFEWTGDSYETGAIAIHYPAFGLSSTLGLSEYPEILRGVVIEDPSLPSGWRVIEDGNATPDPREQYAGNPEFNVPGPLDSEINRAAPRPDGLREQLEAWLERQSA